MDPNNPPPFDELPPDVQQAVVAHYLQNQRQEMEGEDKGHKILDILNGLDGDQLATLRWMFHHMSQNPFMSAFYEGIVCVLGGTKRNVCLACNVNHDVSAFAPETPAEPPATPPANTTPLAAPVEDAVLKAYNLRLAPDASNPNRVQCLGCDAFYVSLDDRMLRNPGADGCDGCKQKAKWG